MFIRIKCNVIFHWKQLSNNAVVLNFQVNANSGQTLIWALNFDVVLMDNILGFHAKSPISINYKVLDSTVTLCFPFIVRPLDKGGCRLAGARELFTQWPREGAVIDQMTEVAPGK